MISVIVPIYNVEKYLYNSVESVRKQTYENLEIILVDDGSPDHCGHIADEFSKKDKRIKVIHKQNGGLSDARNAGLKIAAGTYVFFFDSDDYIDSELISKAYEAYIRTNADLVCFNYISYDENTYEESRTSFNIKNYKNKEANLVIAKYLKYQLGYCVWNKLYRMDIIRKYKIQFEDNSKVFSEDICFNLYYISFCSEIQVIGEHLYYYLIRESSIMGRNRAKIKLNQFIQISKCYETYLTQLETPNEMLFYQEIIFSLLMQMQLQRVERNDRVNWVNAIEDRKYFNKKSNGAIYHIDRWIDVFGFFTGLKQWLKTVEYYYGENGKAWIYALRWLIFELKRE